MSISSKDQSQENINHLETTMSTNHESTFSTLVWEDQLTQSWASSLSKRDPTMDNQQPDLQQCETMSFHLPKFKMNEPGPAAMMSSIFQQNNMVNDESEQSFVVLGKASFESVKETSLASYVELKQKNIPSDQLSTISTMSPSEKEDNLKKVLEENIQLKETLKQNNEAIKEQFDTIKIWQKEVMSVCDSHKQRFLEAKEFMSYLKKENDVLREKMNNYQSCLTLNDASLLPKSHPIQPWQQTSDEARESSFKTTCCNLDKEIQSLKVQEESANISSGSCKKDSQVRDIDLKSPARKIDGSVSPNPKTQEEISKFTCKNDQIEYLKGIITSLQQQLVQFEESKFSASDVCLESPMTTSPDKNSSAKNVALYKEIIEQLRKSFTSQCARYLLVQDLLKESADILLTYKNSKIIPNDLITDDDLQKHVQKLHSNREKLVNQQLEVISDKQSVLKALKEFQRILSDFNTMSYEMEILKDENSKLLVMQKKVSEETLEELTQLEKNLEQEKKELQNKETTILEDMLNFQVEKKLILDEKEKIETERRSLILETENLERTRKHLIGEKESLNHQSKLYETEKENLQQDKNMLQIKCEWLVAQINNLRKDLDEAHATIQQLRARNHKLSDNEEIISVYRIQTEMHMKEFEEMKVAHKNLQDQLQSLATVNLQLQTENERLGGNRASQNSSAESRYCSICSQYIVPGDRHGLGVCQNLLDFD